MKVPRVTGSGLKRRMWLRHLRSPQALTHGKPARAGPTIFSRANPFHEKPIPWKRDENHFGRSPSSSEANHGPMRYHP